MLAVLLTASVLSTASAQEIGQHGYQYLLNDEEAPIDHLNYLLFLPDSYGQDPDKKWPLILFLHGSGERGNDLEKLKVLALPKIVEQQTDFPFVVLSPQLPSGTAWDDPQMAAAWDGPHIPLFKLNKSLREAVDAAIISEELRQEFAENGINLGPDCFIHQNPWINILFDVTGDEIKEYRIRHRIMSDETGLFDAWMVHYIGWKATDLLIELLDGIIATHNIDPHRVYLTGLSLGGYGTWNLATYHPNRFAAIAPICGGGVPRLAWRLQNTPTWAFHGEKDDSVPPSESESMVRALEALGGEVRFTLYPDVGHNAWDPAYDDPELYEWFLSHSLETSPTVVEEQEGNKAPTSYALYPNYPNPFNSETVIRFALPTAADVDLSIFNLAGQQVATLVEGARKAGAYTVNWDGRDKNGRALASGVYLYRLRTGDGQQVETRKLILVR